MAFDADDWIEQDADPSFLADGLLRDALTIPEGEFARAMSAARGALKIRFWSAEVWCRSVLAGHSIGRIEGDLWRNGH
jgi:hypothetical protein